MSLHANTVLTMRLQHRQYNALCYPEDPKFFYPRPILKTFHEVEGKKN